MLSIDRIDHIQYNKLMFLSSGYSFLVVFSFAFCSLDLEIISSAVYAGH